MTMLCIHIGFMPEEISAKLKPDLESLDTTNRSILIITRENIDENGELFEQSLLRYKGLSEAIRGGDYARTFTEKGTSLSCKAIKESLEGFLKFDVENYRLNNAKKKLQDGHPELTIVQIGRENVTDIYLQFPEMGYQSNLALELAKRIFKGLFAWLQPQFNNKMYNHILLDAFGAGGSLHEDLEPGSMSEIAGVINIRRFLDHLQNYKSKSILHFFKEDVSYPNFGSFADKNSLIAQEAARFFYIKLANRKLKNQNENENIRISFELSSTYVNGGLDEDIRENYVIADDKLTSLQIEINSLDIIASASTKVKSELAEQVLEISNEKSKKEKEKNDIKDRLKEIKRKEMNKFEKIINISDEKMDFIIKGLDEKISNYKKHTISCSASFFLDEAVKTASRILLGHKAADANMEDDLFIKLEKHVKKLLERYGHTRNIKLKSRCARVNCDPFIINNEFKGWLKQWVKIKRYTLQDYVDAILWKASGFQPKFLPEKSNWVAEHSLFNSERPKLFFKVSIDDEKSIIIDPFWREIGTDLLADIVAKKACISEPDDVNQSKLVESARDMIGKLNDWNTEEDFSYTKELKGLIKCFLETNQLKENTIFALSNFTKEEVNQLQRLVDGACQKIQILDVANDQYKELDFNQTEIKEILEKITSIKEAEKLRLKLVENGEQYKVWIRKQSWCGNIQQTLDQLRINGAVADRALYVSSNIVALEELGKKRIEQIHKFVDIQRMRCDEKQLGSFVKETPSCLRPM